MADDTRYIYTPNGRPAYCRVGSNIYSVDGGKLAFWVSDTWWHSHAGGAEYYENENWIYSKDSKASYHCSS